MRYHKVRHDSPRSGRDALSKKWGYTRLDKIRSEIIRKELQIPGIQDVRTKYKQNSINHLQRMDNNRLPKHALNYKPRGRRDRGRPRKGWQLSMPEQSNDLIHGGRWWLFLYKLVTHVHLLYWHILNLSDITWKLRIVITFVIVDVRAVRYFIEQCFSTVGPRPGTEPWHQLYRAARGSPGICCFSFLCSFHE